MSRWKMLGSMVTVASVGDFTYLQMGYIRVIDVIDSKWLGSVDYNNPNIYISLIYK